MASQFTAQVTISNLEYKHNGQTQYQYQYFKETTHLINSQQIEQSGSRVALAVAAE